MDNRNIIVRSIEFIEDHLKCKLSVLELSKQIGYSYHHFSRLFQATTGLPARDYILRRRLTEAVTDILSSSQSMTEIAYQYQFGNSESFSRSIKKMFGLTPSEIRRSGTYPPFGLFHRLKESNILHIERIKSTPPELIGLPPIHLIGMVLWVKDNPHQITETWAHFIKNVPLIHNRIQPERYYQLGFWSDDHEMDGFFVMCAVEVPNLNHIPLSLTGKVLPAAKYLKFVHKGYSRDVSLTYKYIFETWLPKSEYRLPFPFEFEFYGDRYLGPEHIDSESDIYIPIELQKPL